MSNFLRLKLYGAFLIASLLFLGCSHSPQNVVANDSQRFSSVLNDYTAQVKRLDAFDAPHFGIEEDLGKFGDYPSPELLARWKTLVAETRERLRAVRPENLGESDRRAWRLFRDKLDLDLESFEFPFEFLLLTQMGNRLSHFMDQSSKELTEFPFDSAKHYRDFVSRADEFPLYVDREIDLLQRGMKAKITLSCVVVKQVPNTYRAALDEKVESNPFWRPITFMPQEIKGAERSALESAFRETIAKKIVPAYRKFDRFFKTEYAPHCRKDYGIGGLPKGKEWYAYFMRESTGLKLSAEEVHRTGIAEVARIEREMDEVRRKLGMAGSRAAFVKAVKTNPRYFFKDSASLMAAFEAAKAKTAERLAKYFSLMPKSDYKIVATSNPEDAAGRYIRPTDSIAYGRFVVNALNLRSVPVYGVSTLLAHEAIPGHHFQVALQFEMKDRLSEYQRKLYHSVAFAEGWALYAEYLGNEMGLYEDPLQRLGHLNEELLRAVRLVVDTGIHAYGWSKEKSVSYMKSHLISDDKEIVNESNRYSVWPGQALGYKIGQLKILELRRLAERELGDRFDIREFHAVVIGDGTVSLPVLEEQVKAWIKAKAGPKAS